MEREISREEFEKRYPDLVATTEDIEKVVNIVPEIPFLDDPDNSYRDFDR